MQGVVSNPRYCDMLQASLLEELSTELPLLLCKSNFLLFWLCWNWSTWGCFWTSVFYILQEPASTPGWGTVQGFCAPHCSRRDNLSGWRLDRSSCFRSKLGICHIDTDASRHFRDDYTMDRNSCILFCLLYCTRLWSGTWVQFPHLLGRRVASLLLSAVL